MRINQNISAMNTYSRLTSANNAKSGSLAKLSSGLRINKAGDDAAGLAISEKMRGQVGGLKQATRNAQDGISLIQTAEGALNETHSILNRMRELSVQSASDTNTDADRLEIQKEMDQLSSEITRISNTTEFNTQNLLNGGITDTKFHIGANKGQNISLEIKAMDSFSLGIARNKDIVTGAGAAGVGEVTFGDNFPHAISNGDVIDVVYAAGGTTPAEAASEFTTVPGTGDNTTIGYTGTYTGTEDVELTFGYDQAGGTGYYYSTDGGATKTNFTFDGDGAATVMGLTLTEPNTAPVADAEDTAISLTAAKPEINTKDSITLSINGADEQVIEVDGDATSLKVAGGTYKGLELKFDTKASDTTAGTITTAIETKTASAAVIGANGTVEAEAPAGINVSSQDDANNAIETIDSAIATVSSERSKLGSIQNRLDHTINNLTATAENLSAAESRIRDVDMAEEMMEFTKNNILSQAATSMLAQANQMPQSVLQLLQ